jgi:hypothetical protein
MKPSRRALILSVALAISLVGCGVMLPGKMYSTSDGTESRFEIQTSHGSGDMTAFSPKTGERFTGQYTGTYTGGGSALVSTFNFQTGATSTGTVYMPPSGANARGILRGDKGTVIEVYLDIQTGLRPRGHGEGIDNKGNRYQIQF